MVREEEIASIERELEMLRAKLAAEKEERNVRKTLRPLREVWLEIGIEKLDNHKGVIVRASLVNTQDHTFAS